MGFEDNLFLLGIPVSHDERHTIRSHHNVVSIEFGTKHT